MKTLNQFLSEGSNTPSVKQTTNASGQPAWKAMNKHGKTKFFRHESEDAAYKHAGIERPKPLSEAKEKTVLDKTKSHFQEHGVFVSSANKTKNGHRLRLVPHFKDDERSEEQFGKKVDAAIKAAPFKVTKLKSGESTSESAASIGLKAKASSPKNPYHHVEVHY